jgi:integrase
VASAHIQRVVIIGSKTGIRVGPSELFKLRWDNFDFRRGVITVEAAKKNAQEPIREVPIREDLIELFQFWKVEDNQAGIPWVIHFHGKPVSHVRRAWAETLRKAGITRELTPYCLRHLFATEALAAQVDVGTVAKIMGHSSPLMVLKHYQHVMTRQKKEAVEALSGFRNLSALYGQACMGKKNGPLVQ